MKRPYLIILLLLILSSSIFAAGKCYWQPDGVLVTGIDGMGIGDLVTDMRGGAYVVTSDLYNVYLIRIDKNGNLPWGLSGKTVDTTTMGAFQMNTLGVSDSCGGVIIVWDKFFPTGHRLYAQRVDSSGNNVWSGIGRLATLSDSSQTEHVLVSDNQKGVIVAWQESWNGQYDIYAQRLDSSGARKWGGNGKVVCNEVNNQTEPGVICDNKKGAYIDWLNESTGYDVNVQKIDSVGNSLWGTNGNNICGINGNQWSGGAGTLCSIGDSAICVVWLDDRNGNYDVYAQKINNNGDTLWSFGGDAVCLDDSNQLAVRVIPDDEQDAIIRWIDQRNGNKDIYAQKIDINGDKKWNIFGLAVCSAESTQEGSKMVTDGKNGGIICWHDKRSGNNDIYAQHVDSAGNAKWTVNGMAVCTATWTQERPKMVASDSGTSIIAWPDGRSGQWRAYAQRVGDDPNGVEGEPEGRIQNAEFRIYQNSPNPFRQVTVLCFQLPQGGVVSLKIFNISGQLVKTLIHSYMPAGMHTCRWDGKDAKGMNTGNGVYFYSLSFKDRLETKKIILIK